MGTPRCGNGGRGQGKYDRARRPVQLTRSRAVNATESYAPTVIVALPLPATCTVGPEQVPDLVREPWMTSQYVPALSPVCTVTVFAVFALFVLKNPRSPRLNAIRFTPSSYQLATGAPPT